MNDGEISNNKLLSDLVIKDEEKFISKNEQIIIQELIRSNENLREEITELTQYSKIRKDEEYKQGITLYKQQIKTCQETINEFQKTIHSLEKEIKQLYINRTEEQCDHEFFDELFHLCLKYSSKKSSTISHQDMKIYIQQTFRHLIKRSYKIYFTCQFLERMNSDYYPDYQDCLNIIQQYQTLFRINCFTQIQISLIDFYQKYAELQNFLHSLCSMIEIEGFDQNLLMKTLRKLVEEAKSDQMNTFKKLANVKNMNEAIRKLDSYNNFVPYYRYLIEELISLLEVSNKDQVIPAIKTLKLLAHNDKRF